MRTPEQPPNSMRWDGFTSQVAAAYPGLPANAPARTMRAIYHPNSDQPLEFLGDRMADRGDVKPLLDWLHRHARAIQKHVAMRCLSSSSSEWFTFHADNGNFCGTPNGSYGYFYCVAWLDQPAPAPTPNPANA